MSNTKLDPEVKEKWLEQLRSGQIEQGAGWLGKESGERCCLGVLCDVAFEESVIDTRRLVEADGVLQYGVDPEGDDDDLETTDLPVAVSVWAFGPRGDEYDSSLTNRVMIDHPEYGVIHLAVLNDGAPFDASGGGGHRNNITGKRFEIPKHTFAQIADLIEEHL